MRLDQEHTITFTAAELAAILSLALSTLTEEVPPDPEFQLLQNSLVSVAEKISAEIGFAPVSIPDPVHVD